MRYRVLVLPVVGAIVVLGGFLVSGNLNDNLVYYLAPSEAVSKRTDFPDGERFRLGGFVEKGTVKKTDDGVRFTVSGASNGGGGTVDVDYTGAPAQLFRAGIGVVVEGAWRGGSFAADAMIIKHDSEYRPPNSSTDPSATPTAPEDVR